MIKKILLLNSIFFSFCFASYEQVKIGKIDRFYENKITKEEIRQMINEIEYLFESKLKMNVFDYSQNGKAIDFIYLANSKLEQRIERKKEIITLKKDKIEKIQNTLPIKLKNINTMEIQVNKENNILNKKIKTLNAYVKKVNKQKSFKKDEYERIKNYIKLERKKVKDSSSEFKEKQRELQSTINLYNKKVRLQNSLIREFNRTNNELERLTRNFQKVRANTLGQKEVTTTIFTNNGKRVKEKKVKNIMNKIEIYGFESKNELKVILAHEIAHLLGIPHINVKNALMHPILQKSQIKQLSLTQSDIRNFRKNF